MRKLAMAVFCVLSLTAAQSDSGTVRIGLALSGGAALGMAHIGVLKVLEEAGIPVAFISGNSMGSMVGGVYAAGYSAAQIESIAVGANWGVLFSSAVPFGAKYLPERQQAERYVVQLRHRNLIPYLPSGLVPLQNVEFLLMDLLSETEHNTGYRFDSLPLPYRAVAVDLVDGTLQVLDRGRLAKAIRASIAIPGVFSPERLDGMELVDGGVQQYLPVEPLLEFEPDLIIAVLTMKRNREGGFALIDVVSRSMDVIGVEDLARQKGLADVVIEPNVDPFAHSDFARVSGLIAAGEAAARAALPEIRFKLAGRRPVAVRRPVPVRPLAVVRKVDFVGLKQTKEAMLRPMLETRRGRYLLFSRLRADLQRVFNTGLFEGVNYRLVSVPGDSVDVVIDVDESAYGFYLIGLRYDNEDNLGLGLEVGQGNLGGSGAQARAVLHLGNPNEVRAGLTGTRVFNFPFGYRLDGYASSYSASYYARGQWQADYAITRIGGVAEAGYVLGRDAFFNFGLVAYQARYGFPPVFGDTLPRREWVAGPTFRVEASSFDDLFLPTRGLSWSLNVLYSSPDMKASREFLRVDVSAERVVPMGRRFLLRHGADFGFHLGSPAWSERFRCGGGSLPGFTRDEFTSAHKAALRFAFDYRVTNLLRADNYPLYVGAFATAATFEPLAGLIEESDRLALLHWSAGLGLRTNSPLGPVALAVGVSDPGRRNARLNFRVAVGRDFRYPR